METVLVTVISIHGSVFLDYFHNREDLHNTCRHIPDL